MNKPETYNSSIIDNLFNEIPAEDFAVTGKKMLLAAKLSDAIKAMGLKKSELAKRLNKRPSEITKWLSGTHNFTIDTLCDLEKELGINLINVENKQVQNIIRFHIEITTPANIVYQPGIYSGSPVTKFGSKKPRKLLRSGTLFNYNNTTALA